MYCQLVIYLTALFVFKNSTNIAVVELLTNNNLTSDFRHLSILSDNKSDLCDLDNPDNAGTSKSMLTKTHPAVNDPKACPNIELHNSYDKLLCVSPTKDKVVNYSARNLANPASKTNLAILDGAHEASNTNSHRYIENLSTGMKVNATLSEHKHSSNANTKSKIDSLPILVYPKENTSSINIGSSEINQRCHKYPVPIPVKITMDGISICYQAPPLPIENNIEGKNYLVSESKMNDELCQPLYIDTIENHSVIPKNDEKIKRKFCFSSTNSSGLLSDLTATNFEKTQSPRSHSASPNTCNNIITNNFDLDITQKELSVSVGNYISSERNIYSSNIPNKSKEIPIPEYVDLSPQIMIEELTNSLVHEKNLTLIDFSYYNANDTPHYLPLLSSVSYKEECEFEDIREEDEEESRDEEEDDYPSSWDDVDTKMLSSPRVRSQNAWSVVGVPMTNSSFDFFEEKDRLKLRNPPKLSQPNTISHNKYASDSNINDALVMLEPGLRKMAKDEYYTTTNSSCATEESQTDDNGKSLMGSQGARTSTQEDSLTCKVSVNGQDHIYNCIDDTHAGTTHSYQNDEDSENFYEIPIEKASELECSNNPNSEHRNANCDYNNKNLKETINVDHEDSGFYSYTIHCDEDPRITSYIKPLLPKNSQANDEFITCNNYISSSMIDKDEYKMEDTATKLSSNNKLVVTNDDSKYCQFQLDHVTRIPINQSESTSLPYHINELDVETDHFITNCSTIHQPNVTVNGVYFSQRPITDDSKRNDTYCSVRGEDDSLLNLRYETSKEPYSENISERLSPIRFEVGERDATVVARQFEATGISQGQTKNVTDSKNNTSRHHFNRHYDLMRHDDNMMVRIDGLLLYFFSLTKMTS